MADVTRKSRLLRALDACFLKERGADKPPFSHDDPCKKCPYEGNGCTCRVSLFEDVGKYLRGVDDRQQVEIGYDAYGEDVPICPQCEYQLRTGFAYCPKCGTAIDWDDYAYEGGYFEEEAVQYDDYGEGSMP